MRRRICRNNEGGIVKVSFNFGKENKYLSNLRLSKNFEIGVTDYERVYLKTQICVVVRCHGKYSYWKISFQKKNPEMVRFTSFAVETLNTSYFFNDRKSFPLLSTPRDPT